MTLWKMLFTFSELTLGKRYKNICIAYSCIAIHIRNYLLGPVHVHYKVFSMNIFNVCCFVICDFLNLETISFVSRL